MDGAMTPTVFGCVMFAAVLHASWNAVLRGGSDRLWSMTLMMIAIACVTSFTTLFISWPNAASWPYVVASAVVHTLYNLALVRTYSSGDLGQTYPISRGSSPVLVTLGASIFAHETITFLSTIGILLVSGGIVSLAFQRRMVRADSLAAAFVTGVLIGAYSVIDGIGVRLAGDSLVYSNAMFLLWSITTPIIYFALHGKAPAYTGAQTMTALMGGLVSLLAYSIVIWAMRFGAMGVVSALRETSVIYAAIIGRFFLNEKLTARRIVSCIAIVSGVACLAA
jgi:drug/metabolite transporter (DMT)-like permease